jgi:hypothetical protein
MDISAPATQLADKPLKGAVRVTNVRVRGFQI